MNAEGLHAKLSTCVIKWKKWRKGFNLLRNFKLLFRYLSWSWKFCVARFITFDDSRGSNLQHSRSVKCPRLPVFIFLRILFLHCKTRTLNMQYTYALTFDSFLLCPFWLSLVIDFNQSVQSAFRWWILAKCFFVLFRRSPKRTSSKPGLCYIGKIRVFSGHNWALSKSPNLHRAEAFRSQPVFSPGLTDGGWKNSST